MEPILEHVRDVVRKTTFFPPEAFVPDDDRFERWHMPFLETLTDQPPAQEVIDRLTAENVWKGNIRMFLYMWWVSREKSNPFSDGEKKDISTYMTNTKPKY